MQIFLRVFLSMYIGHLLADYVLQTHRLVEQKQRGKPAAYAIHGLIHYLAVAIVLGIFLRGYFFSGRMYFVILALTIVHLLIDFARMKLAKKRPPFNGTWAYITDQVFHFLTVFFAAWLLTPGARFADLAAWLGRLRDAPTKYLSIPVVYIIVIFGGGYLIRFLTRSQAAEVEGPADKSGSMQNAGMYIGWLERFLVVTALLLQSPAMVGLILTAKSIARYSEIQSEKRFVEYFLIGTLLSISIALIAGAVLSEIIFGHVRLT
jgi:hypothetical protein